MDGKSARPGSAPVPRRRAGLGALALAATAATATARAATPGGTWDLAGHVRTILPDLERYVRQGMADWHIPGAAIGVMVGDEVLLSAGYGVRRDGEAAAVDARTLFQIGSLTKAFCAATEAVSVDRHLMAWSDRVIDHDPDFRMLDPWVTRQFQIADLLAQRSGLPPYVLDLMWALGFGPEARIAALRDVHPVSSFRTTFAYQNILQLVAGRIVARKTGAADWAEALHRLLLDPLVMSDTNTSVAALTSAVNHATGHVWFAGRMWQPPIDPDFENVGAAGAINSNLQDMLIWLRLQMGQGTINGRRIVSAANLTETWRPRVEIRPSGGKSPRFPALWAAYASGWIFQVTPGGTVVWHNGGTGAYRSHLGFIPDRRVGFVMLTNEGNNELIDAAALWFYDRVLGNPAVDYSAEQLVAARESEKKVIALRRRPDTAMPPAPLDLYAGPYHSRVFQDVSVAPDGSRLKLDFLSIGRTWMLQPWNGDVFMLEPAEAKYADAFATGEPQFVLFSRQPSGQAGTIRFLGSDDLTLRRSG